MTQETTNVKDSGQKNLNDPETRKIFKSRLQDLTSYFQAIDDHREGLKDSVASLSTEYGLDKKTIRKLAKTLYNHDYGSVLEENRQFEATYEMIIEGKIRDEATQDSDE